MLYTYVKVTEKLRTCLTRAQHVAYTSSSSVIGHGTRMRPSIFLRSYAGDGMNVSREQLIMVLDLSASSKVKKLVSERVNAGLCLGETTDGKNCECKARTRGLCEKCHYRWRMARLRMNESDAAVYDSKLIRLGRLLSANGAKQYKNKSVFKRLA